MPSLVRKILIFAAVDGLVLQPVAQRNQRSDAAVKIDYNTHSILPQLRDVSAEQPAPLSFESHGIIGLLTLASSSYLISILRREPVAQFWGKPVYVITDVALIPISSQSDAENAIRKAAASLKRHPETDTISSSASPDDADMDTVTSTDDTVLDDHGLVDSKVLTQDGPAKKLGEEKDPGIAESVIGRKGVYGRFAEKWFSRRGWIKENMKLQGMSVANELEPEVSEITVAAETGSGSIDVMNGKNSTESVKADDVNVGEGADQALLASMTPKLMQTAKLLLGSKTFFFSYDYDLTRRLSSQRRLTSDVPLHKQADPQYFWNEHLTSSFIESGHHGFVLPIMQGFVGQTSLDLETVPSFSINKPQKQTSDSEPHGTASGDKSFNAVSSSQPPEKLLLTLISRRSVNRAGLRYLRRGIDENGNVANNVETEQILSSPNWARTEKIQSFVQIRGSMPIFFSQTPYTFKPLPVLHGSTEANQKAMRKHFAGLTSQYGSIQAVSLIDRHGSEGVIGEAYEDNVKQLNSSTGSGGGQVGFEWFEFHHVCRGMKFENVSILVDSMNPFLESSGWTSSTSQLSLPSSLQTGIIRTNCMDCLDRTNVVQSAFAQHILEQQLKSFANSALTITSSSTSHINSLWADNGDAVSRAYAGTAALKGDYTRTRKRNLRGALTDLTLTLSRYYRNLFDDFFAQAAIDYLLGNVTSDVFAEFQTTMTTADPAVDMRRARQAAITTASHIVVEESEDLLGGWALAMPANMDDLASRPFEEALLLLSDRAIYAVHFDWNTEKVRSFERVSMECLRSVQWGAYITETVAPAHMDVKRNVGLVLKFEIPADGEAVERSMTRAMANVRDIDEEGDSGQLREGDGTQVNTSTEKKVGILAFKALPPRTSAVRASKGEALLPSEQELVKTIVEEIVMAAARNGGDGSLGHTAPLTVNQHDIISVEEAKKTTGYLEQIGYSLKKMVWG